jgi:hypothetical protein
MLAYRTFVAMLMLAGASSCLFRDPMTISAGLGGRSTSIDVVLDAAEVRQLVAQANASQEAMDRAPHISVRQDTRVRVVEISKARCDYSHPWATVTFVRAVILAGPSKGQQVWICRNTGSE